MAKRRTRGSGSIRTLPSGRHQARVKVDGVTYPAPHTFDTRQAAAIWLKRQHDQIADGTWAPPTSGRIAPITFGEFAEEWLARPSAKTGRPRAPRTLEEYRKDLDLRILPTFGGRPISVITDTQVQRWYDALDATKPTQRAHAYTLVSSIMADAAHRRLIDATPCRIRGASSAKRATKTEVPTPEQVQALADAMPGEKYAVLVLTAAWCGLRFGELAELRRRDLLLDEESQPVQITVRRAVSRVKGRKIVGAPKSAAGVRNVVIPPHVRERLGDYLAGLPKGQDTMIFPGSRNKAHMGPGSLHKVFDPRADALGLDLRFHDLRHFAGTQAAIVGATTAEVMARLGHSTVTAAMRYQAVAHGRDEQIAKKLSDNVVLLKKRGSAAG